MSDFASNARSTKAVAPGALDALLRIAPISQVLYGSDFPFRPGMETVYGLHAYKFSAADLRAIERDNALRLMPSIKAVVAGPRKREGMQT